LDMRDLVGLLCVCALGLVPVLGCNTSSDGDGGTGGTAGSGGGGGSAGGAGGGGSTGTGGDAITVYCDGPTSAEDCTLTVVPVPDFADVQCADAAGANNCPASGETYYGQDGNFSINLENYTFVSTRDPRLVEAVSGLTWSTTALLADSFDDAKGECAALATASYGGLTDWRVPSFRQLGRIISKGGLAGVWPPEMDNPSQAGWWTSTVDKADATMMIGVSGTWPWTEAMPAGGGVGPFAGSRYTFCVSGAEMAGAWVVSLDGATVTHTTTGLTWHRSASADQAMSWDMGLEYCEASAVGDFSDWRLPTLREYVSVFDLDTPSGFMSDAFEPEPTTNMLTGTPNRIGAMFTEVAWANENTGQIRQENISTLLGAARCVRGPL
jgi:hypothetical protein